MLEESDGRETETKDEEKEEEKGDMSERAQGRKLYQTATEN